MSKLQKYLAISVIVLVVILIVARMFYNYQRNNIKWEEGDRQIMIDNCMESLGSYAVRFPGLSEQYCECTSDTLMVHYTKTEYYMAETKSSSDKRIEMTPILSKCYNVYNAAMFDEADF